MGVVRSVFGGLSVVLILIGLLTVSSAPVLGMSWTEPAQITDVVVDGSTAIIRGHKLFYSLGKISSDADGVDFRLPRAHVSDDVPVNVNSDVVTDVDVWDEYDETVVRFQTSSPVQARTRVSLDGQWVRIEFDPPLTHEPAVERLPTPRDPPGDAGFTTVRLRYADAERTALLLRRLIPYGDSQIQVDERLNTLILDRHMDRFEDVYELLASLDRPQAQIVIDARIVEVHADAASQLGLSVSGTAGTTFREKTEFFGEVPLPLQPFVRSPLSINATINLLVGEGSATVLANPRVATVDGEPALVKTEERIPIFVTETSGNQTFRVRQDIVAGIELQITPRINEDDLISTTIETRVASITGTTAEGYPTTSSREAQTNVRVRSGETIVIGGLLERRALLHEEKIPGLGHIPIIGRVFSTVRQSERETELFIIVTPYLLGDDDWLESEY